MYQLARLWIPALETLPEILPPSFSLSTGPAITFILFWLLNMYVVYLGVDSIRRLLMFKAFFLPIAALALLFWAISAGNGLGPILEQPSKFASKSDFFIFWDAGRAYHLGRDLYFGVPLRPNAGYNLNAPAVTVAVEFAPLLLERLSDAPSPAA